MSRDIKTFAQVIERARKDKKLYLSTVAKQILKEDGTSISVQYLSDLEKGRRNAPSELIIRQIADILEIPVEVLYFYAEIFPKEFYALGKDADFDTIVEAYQAFTQTIKAAK